MLVKNDDRDVYLRHAGSLALASIGDPAALEGLAQHESRAVRLAAVIALRRLRHAGVARFMADNDELVVVEAARADQRRWRDSRARWRRWRPRWASRGSPASRCSGGRSTRICGRHQRRGRAGAAFATDAARPAALRAEAVVGARRLAGALAAGSRRRLPPRRRAMQQTRDGAAARAGRPRG